jgi:hypothetical protein
MAEDRDKDTPSLEPPSLFGRKKKAAPAPAAPVADDPVVVEPDRERPSVLEPAAAPAEPPTVAVPVDVVDPTPTTIFDDTSEPTPEPAPAATPSEPEPPREPWLDGRPAAALTGLLVGALIVAATAASLRLCTRVAGTSSCGDPGFFLLVAILVVAVLVGTAMLRAAHVPEPGSTSFLAVGLLSVATLLFLVGSIFEWWMVIVIPLVAVATFLLSHWVTTSYIES